MRSVTWRRPALLGLISAVLSGGIYSWQTAAPPQLRVTFLDVGQGDSIVVQTPSGRTLLVDTGRLSDDDDMGRRVVVPWLRRRGINGIDAMLLTHPDDDHIGGAVTVLQRLRVSRLFIYSDAIPTPNWERVLKTAKNRGCRTVPLCRGQMIDFHDGAVAEVLNPPAGPLFRTHHADNDASLVVRLRYGATSVMLTGDAEEFSEKDMIDSGMDLRADVLKLGHHGSKSSSSEEFLDAVQPAVAIVSAGAKNVYGHPHPSVIERVTTRHIRVLRTDVDGAITLDSDGKQIAISHDRHSAQEQHGRPIARL